MMMECALHKGHRHDTPTSFSRLDRVCIPGKNLHGDT